MKAEIFPNVEIAQGAKLGLFVIVGEAPRGRESGELRTIIGRGCVLRSHTVIYAGNRIGENFQTGHQVMVREENEIGDKVSIGTGSVVEHHVKIEDRVRIHSQAFIPEYSVLKKGCWIGPNVVLTNAKYPNQPETKSKMAGVTIGENAVVGANATVLPGVVIGVGSVVGAGSVVVTDVPAGMVVYGNPAKIEGKTADIGYSLSPA